MKINVLFLFYNDLNHHLLYILIKTPLILLERLDKQINLQILIGILFKILGLFFNKKLCIDMLVSNSKGLILA